MTDSLSIATLAAARRLESKVRPGLTSQVEEILDSESRQALSQSNDDSLTLAGSIVAISSLAWTIYSDMKKRGTQADPDVVTRAVQVQLNETDQTPSDEIVETIVHTIIDVIQNDIERDEIANTSYDTGDPQTAQLGGKAWGGRSANYLYPVIEERSLPEIRKSIFGRARRDLGDLPSVTPSSVLVFYHGTQYVTVPEGTRLTGREEFAVDATEVLLIDMHTRYIATQLQAPSLDPLDDFTIRATFRTRVTDPARVAEEGQFDISSALAAFLQRDSRLLSLTKEHSVERISEIRDLVISRIEAYSEFNPIQLPGIAADLIHAEILLPYELREHERRMRTEYRLQELERLRTEREELQIERYKYLIGQGQVGLTALGLARGETSVSEALNNLRADEEHLQKQFVEAIRILRQSGALEGEDIDPAGMVSAYLEKLTGRSSPVSASENPAEQESVQQTLAIETDEAEDGAQEHIQAEQLKVDIQIFLDDSSPASAVEEALRELLNELGVTQIRETRTVHGSWYRSLVGFLSKASNSDTAAEARRALEVQLLDRYQAGIDGVTGDAVAKLIMSLSQTPGAVVQVGSVILVKADDNIVVRQLTGREMSHWQKNPALFKNPADALNELQRAAVKSSPGQDPQPTFSPSAENDQMTIKNILPPSNSDQDLGDDRA